MIQNAIPIATNTILIISYLRLGLLLGNTPGWSRDFTLIYYTRIGNKILKCAGLEKYPFRLPCLTQKIYECPLVEPHFTTQKICPKNKGGFYSLVFHYTAGVG